MPTEVFVLLDTLDVSVPIYQRVNANQRVPIVKRQGYAPFLQVTCQDKEGVVKNIRYKEACDTIDLDEQIEKKKIQANAKYTNAERNDRQFKNGVCMTSKTNLQRYLKAYPGFVDSPYTSDEVPLKEYMLYEKGKESKIQNAEVRKRAQAAIKVLDLSLEQAQEMLIRLNGSFFETPQPKDFPGTPEEQIQAAQEECQNMLIEFVDAAEDAGLDAVLKDEKSATIDEKTTVLIGTLLNAGLLSFSETEGKISKKGKDGKWIVLRDMSSEYTLDERKRLFSDFLNTEDGKLLKNDLEEDLKNLNKKNK